MQRLVAAVSPVGIGGSGLMVSWRFWSAVVCLLSVAACSGKSQKDADGDDGNTGGSAGESGLGGTASTGDAGESGVGGQGSLTNGVTGVNSSGSSGVINGSSGVTNGSASSGFTSTGFGSSTATPTVSTTVGTTGGSMIPGEWTCTVLAYANDVCDCGCGAPDPDCASSDLDDCEICNSSGSCNANACPGKIDPDDVTACKPPPAGWTCLPETYDDEAFCHCGCGILDPDCESDDPAECDICHASGSCSDSVCPGSIDASDNTTCDLPEGWTCPAYTYGNGLCDCGCGVVDRDCDSKSRDACAICYNGCSNESCPGPIDEADNTICTGVPYSWTCEDRFFGDKSLCHCGCGAVDPDCDSAELEACDRCNFEGSCSQQACPGTIDPANNAYCHQPDPPDTWTCQWYQYADGRTCDCGCGALDLDCRTDSIDECDTCYSCGSYQCPGRVDPDEIASCLPPPDGWTCSLFAYGDGYNCECGCGVKDPDCESELATVCDSCPVYQGSCVDDYDCRDIDPEDNSRCTDSPPDTWNCDVGIYGDGACDCGCGVRDLDCPSGSSDDCEFCAEEGSCSSDNCPGSIDETDNAICTD